MVVSHKVMYVVCTVPGNLPDCWGSTVCTKSFSVAIATYIYTCIQSNTNISAQVYNTVCVCASASVCVYMYDIVYEFAGVYMLVF